MPLVAIAASVSATWISKQTRAELDSLTSHFYFLPLINIYFSSIRYGGDEIIGHSPKPERENESAKRATKENVKSHKRERCQEEKEKCCHKKQSNESKYTFSVLNIYTNCVEPMKYDRRGIEPGACDSRERGRGSHRMLCTWPSESDGSKQRTNNNWPVPVFCVQSESRQ